MLWIANSNPSSAGVSSMTAANAGPMIQMEHGAKSLHKCPSANAGNRKRGRDLVDRNGVFQINVVMLIEGS